MNESIKKWYQEKYPSDECGEDLDENATFTGLFETMDHRKDIYEYIGQADSIIRERCFEKLAELIGTDYDYVYMQWLLTADRYQ